MHLAPPDDNDPLHDLVAECLARLEQEGEQGVDRFLAKHQGVAGVLRERLSRLRTHGLIGGSLSQIGPFRLLDVLGEGGMGVVYLAEQREPVRRRVALKVVRLGVASQELVARFEVERQALAMMNHPNIARLFEAGTAPNGQPYFVMEYVPGVPITDYCDRQRLGMNDRLRLFIQACRAVQHAHQVGVMHRDLKPSNILVQAQDESAQVKIIDFGLAKAMGQHLTAKTLFTEQGRILGTPEYMSPEQAEMTGLNVDARTDVYSLGVVLYEVLTGALPFDGPALRRAGHLEIQRVIREEDPPRPSTRVSTSASAKEAALQRRQTDGVTLARALRGDLDWITMRALEKDPRRRYQAASALASDVERHLRHEPVEAGPPGFAYVVSKLVRRHRRPLLTVLGVSLALALGFLAATQLAVPGSGVGPGGLDLSKLARASHRWERFPEQGIEFEIPQAFVRNEPSGTARAATPLVARFEPTDSMQGKWVIELLAFPDAAESDPFDQWVGNADPLRHERHFLRRAAADATGPLVRWDYRDSHPSVQGIEVRRAAVALREGESQVVLVVSYPLRKKTHVAPPEEEHTIATMLGSMRAMQPEPQQPVADGWDLLQKGDHVAIYSWESAEGPEVARAAASMALDVLDGSVSLCASLLPPAFGRSLVGRQWVVRVWGDRERKEKGGAVMPGMIAYFDTVSGELIVASRTGVAEGDVLRKALLHEAWHQVSFGCFDGLQPHLWYNEGVADFIASHDRRNGAWSPVARSDRRTTLLGMMARDSTIPLRDLVRLDREGFYKGGRVLDMYAESYAFVAFLADPSVAAVQFSGTTSAPSPSPLVRYVEALITHRSPERASAETFAGVDWERLQAAWGAWVRNDLYPGR